MIFFYFYTMTYRHCLMWDCDTIVIFYHTTRLHIWYRHTLQRLDRSFSIYIIYSVTSEYDSSPLYIHLYNPICVFMILLSFFQAILILKHESIVPVQWQQIAAAFNHRYWDGSATVFEQWLNTSIITVYKRLTSWQVDCDVFNFLGYDYFFRY